ncbi:hypothetical protein ACH4VR_15945 [Streptomyces sp. NPDC020883]|uniref:hypothetical protein n=1 Tax=Streptomyces sp. NPDC020883 TaxID=3365099 RepID=UPI0037A85E33
MYADRAHRPPIQRTVEVHQPTPLPHVVDEPAPVIAVQPGSVPAVASIVLPDGRIATGYAIEPAKAEPALAKPAASRAAVNVALGGIGFGAVCGGLCLLTAFVTALTALITQLITLAAICFGGWFAVQIFKPDDAKSGITFHIHKAVFKRNHFNG